MSIIDEEIAKRFMDDPDNVDLYYMGELSGAAAESLSKQKGDLYLNHLNCLTELSDAAAESLSMHNGNINGEDPAEWADSLREG
ncbi:hypothetical protein OAF87_02705 [Akkermansiaceae bacterium]|nr:hypothetical protein [Akkermansiaceae bacterium]MDB4311565.1 hypothetical protein [bacterium]MDB4630646.1 hypothetical protein [Akkermansiaceae bacterium]MDB4681890.1 hypothetical protein [Akkermansiaceae bacterium]MDB4740709.1 hypothetical protein [Akkermansiaceae bacterium]